MGIADFKRLHIETIEKWQTSMDRDYRYYEDYTEMLAEVEKMRGVELSASNADHKNFLIKLLLERYNGIANVGSVCTLTPNKFESFIGDSNMLVAIKGVIENPSLDTANIMEKIANQHGGKQNCNNTIVNRVVAASTTKVCQPVYFKYFKDLFSFLIEREIIADYPSNNGRNWYNMSTYLMEQLTEIFATEIKADKTNEVYLSVFMWVIYRKRFRNKGKIKLDF